MKLLLVAVTLLATGFGLTPKPTQDPQEMPKPGPEHALLMKHVGSWDAVVIMQDEQGQEQRSKAAMTTRAMGGFHTIDDFQGDFMGTPFTGHGTNSYCQVRKRYVASWADSMVSSPLTLTGTYDAKTKVLTMTGECVGMSGKMEPCRTVTEFQDDDHYAFEMHGAGPDGNEMKMLRIEYTRRK